MPPDGSAAGGTRGRGVLVVDDSPTVRATVGEMLGRLGYAAPEVGFAGSAEEARHEFEARGPKLVFLDLELGSEETGERLALDFLGRAPETRIVLMTGFAEQDEKVRRVVRLGAFAYLGKPLRFQALQRVLRELRAEEYFQGRIK